MQSILTPRYSGLALAVLAAGSLISLQASATVLFSETFEGLTNGDLNTQNGWAVTSDANGFNVADQATMAYTGVNFGSKMLVLTEDNTPGTASKAIGSSLQSQAKDIYIGFYYYTPDTSFNQIWGVSLESRSNTFFGKEGDGNNAIDARLFGGAESNGSGWNTGTTVAVLAKLTWGGSDFTQIDMWFEQDGSTLPDGTGTADATVAAGGSAITLDDILIEAGRFNQNDEEEQFAYFDNLTVATSASEAMTGVVPEPASLALMGLGGLLLLGRSRRHA